MSSKNEPWLDFTGREGMSGDWIVYSQKMSNGGLSSGRILKRIVTGYGRGLRILWWSDHNDDYNYYDLDQRNGYLIVGKDIIPNYEGLEKVYNEIISDPKLNKKLIKESL